VLTGLRSRLQEGKSLSDALKMSEHSFPQLLIASIRASERTSRLHEALNEYLAYDRAGQELGRKVVSAAIYPLLVVGFGLVVSLFMVAYVVPRFAKVYDDVAHSISWPTLVLMRTGQLVSDHLAALLLGLAVAVALVVRLHGLLNC
jgi:general secretion pathway protein F